MEWVGELERTLAETQAVVSPELDSDPADERIRQLETALGQAQRFAAQQQAEMETLQEALSSQQQRVAEMERNCVAALQERREQEEKTALLTESCRRLQDRLDREQRQNLQLKQALDRCLASQDRMRQEETSAASSLEQETLSVSPESQLMRRRIELPYFLSTASGSMGRQR
jgi:chromosome segregation ATPase